MKTIRVLTFAALSGIAALAHAFPPHVPQGSVTDRAKVADHLNQHGKLKGWHADDIDIRRDSNPNRLSWEAYGKPRNSNVPGKGWEVNQAYGELKPSVTINSEFTQQH